MCGGVLPLAPELLGGLAGLPPGWPNTVPVAELFAAYVAVSNIPCTADEVTIYPDSALVVKEYEPGESHCLKHSALAEIWALFWEAVRAKPGITIHVRKCKAHAEDLPEGLAKPFETFGNVVADALASAGAVEASPYVQRNLQDIRRVETLSSLVLGRLRATG